MSFSKRLAVLGLLVAMLISGGSFAAYNPGGGGGSPAFNAISSGTNTGSTMTLGTGGTLTYSGSGVVNANQLNGQAQTIANQTFVSTSASAGGWQTIPDCQDSSGNHLNFTQSTHTLSCGTTASGGGSNAYTFQSITTSSSISGTHKAIACNATGGAVTITLPAASATSGADFAISKIDSTANACTITRAGSDTIWGQTTLVLASQNVGATLVADGTSTWIVF